MRFSAAFVLRPPATPALLCLLLVLGCASLAQGPPPPKGIPLRGFVKSGNTPIPGAKVTLTDPASGNKFFAWTDLDGSYSVEVPAAGHYAVTVEMPAFATLTRDVSVAASGSQSSFDLTLASRSPQPAPGQGQRQAGGNGTGAGRGFQALALLQAQAGLDAGGSGDQMVPQGMPNPGIAADTATESIAVSGNNSSPNMLGMSSNELQQRMQQYRDQLAGGGGSLAGAPNSVASPTSNTTFGAPRGNGGGAGGPGGPGGFGGGQMIMFRGGRLDVNHPHGSAYYSLGNDALNASPYSLTGQPTTKAGIPAERFGASLGGPLIIPRIYNGGSRTFFFVNYNGSHASNPYDAFSTVPTIPERQGDFSHTLYSSGISRGQPIEIFGPGTSGGNQVTAISPTALALLNYIPLPNLPGGVQNFHYVTSATSNLDDFNLRVVRNFGGTTVGPHRRGPQNNLNVGFHYHSTETGLTNPFPTVGGNTSVRSFDIPVGYTRSFGKLINSFRVDFNRNRVSTQNLYAFESNVAGAAGITGISTNPFDWGLPNLAFTNFGGIQDTNPLLQRNQTWTFSDSMILNHGKHTWRWGGDFRRVELNTETDSNARGSFVFTGLNTALVSGGTAVPGTGFDFADFLLGASQQNSVQFGENNYHFRGNSWDLYVQDEWKVRGNLTFNLGLRYEYVSPFSEINDRIVNLAVNPSFTAAVPVVPGQDGLPSSLLHADRNNFAPRLGVAWKALPKTVFRAGYGINYNTTAYSSIVQQLGFQPPFSVTQTNVQAVGSAPLGFGFADVVPPGVVTNSYGVNPNYRLGYLQIWNVDVQQEIRPTLILNLDYTGTKGTRLDVVTAPNSTLSGTRIPNVQPFLFQDSQASSIAHAGTVRLRKRLQGGISVGGSYTWSKAIDNASTIGGGTTVPAQNAFDPAAERGLSYFDQRHRFTGDYLVELPFGHDRRWLAQSGLLRDVFGDWQWSGDWTIASGFPFSPRILGNIENVSGGVNGTLRAQATGLPSTVPDPSVSRWFNTAAFTLPPSGVYGDAGRNTIEGPGSLLVDMALTRVVPLKENRTLEFRVSAANVFSRPQFTAIDTIVNSPSYGRVIQAGPMRTILLTARFRF